MTIIDFTNAEKEQIQGHTSKGDQPKWHKGNLWYKADHMGYEGLSEVVVSQLSAYSNLPEYVTYEPVKIIYDGKTVNGCASNNFRREDEMLVPLEQLHRAYFGTGLAHTLGQFPDVKERIKYTVDFVEEKTGLKDFGAYITFLLELDTFFLNEDRHTNNLAVIRNESSKEYRLCPAFDHGLSLLSDLNDYPENADVYDAIKRVEAKPFSSSFETQMFAAEELYGSRLKFTFTRKDVETILSSAEAYYGKDLCRRVEQVIAEQMRKYRGALF